MHDIALPAPPPHPVWLIVNHAASAMVLGLCASLPATAATFLAALTASCLTNGGCHTSTAMDALVPIVAITIWTTATGLAGVHYARNLLKTNDQPHTPATAPRRIRP